ncbi:MAG: O-antigen ligase family protein [Pelagibacteraceae bacterium]
MKSLKNLSINQKILNGILCLIPISYILGNLAINLNFAILIIFSLLAYSKKIFLLKLNKPKIFLLLFFSLIIYSTLIDIFFGSPENKNLIKCLIYLRFLLLIFVISYLIKEQEIKLKYFFLSCLICSTFVSIDIIYQFIFKIDFFGFKYSGYHYSGLFGKELIAGSYIQKFLMVGVFAIPLYLGNKNKINFLFILALTAGFCGILLSGNRMPLIIFIGFLLISALFVRKFKYELIFTLIIAIPIYFLIINSDKVIKEYHQSFFQNVKSIIPKISLELPREYPELKNNVGKKIGRKGMKNYEVIQFGAGHAVIYITAIDTWLDAPILGSGIKSFRLKCNNKTHLPNRVCESHPHNYYLGILNSAGALGLFLILCALYFLLKKRFYINRELPGWENYIVFNCLFTNILMEFFPFRSAGSFFSTSNSSYIFLLIGLMVGYSYINSNNKISS